MRRIIGILAIWALLAAVPPTEVLAGQVAGDVVTRFFEAYRSGSVDRMLQVYASDAVFEDVSQRHRFEGSDALRAFLTRVVAMHHRIDLREKRRVVHGDVVVVEYEYTGFLNGAVLGQSVGKEGCPDLEYTLPTTSWYEVQGDRIVHQKDLIDMATLLELRETLLAGGATSGK